MPVKIDALASKLLSKRNYTEHEFRQKLISAGFENEEINRVIADYLEIGWLNDLNYLESYIHYQSERGLGPVKIMQALAQKGIARFLISENINLSDIIWQTRALDVWKKKFKSIYPTSQLERQKQFRFLMQRGFTQQQILSALKTQTNQFDENHE